ncbi:MAG: HDIG domain-containing metalloprotein [Candidatus Omnitrophota bacterium]
MSKDNVLKKIKETARRSETLSILAIAGFLAAALYSMFISPQLSHWSVHEGDIALKNVYAPYGFTYSWEVDEERTAKAREDAARDTPFSFIRRRDAEKQMISGLEGFFSALEAERGKDAALSEKVEGLKNRTGGTVAEKNLRFFLEYPDQKALREGMMKISGNVFLMGYASEDDINYVKEQGGSKAVIRDEETGAEIQRGLEALLDAQKAREMIDSRASAEFADDRKAPQAVSALVSAYVSPNLKIDTQRTAAEKELAAKRTEPVYQKWNVEKNELIIEKGKRINARHIAQVKQVRRFFRPGTTPTFFFGIMLLFMLLGLIAFIQISVIQKVNFLKDTKNVVIVLLNMLLVIILSDIIIRSPQPSYFIPMASMGMLVTLLVGIDVAFLCVVLGSVLIALLAGGGIELMLVLVTGSTVGMFAVRDARSRGKIVLAGLLVGVVKFFAIACIGLINGMDLDFYVRDGVWGIASGLFSGFIVMGLLPVFEYVFKVSTNISLLELSDLNHPLLKKLAMEAPGTYHHSIMVGNLAEVACDAIGANSLQSRVGAYYHDIGKISKAEYFSENEMGVKSKHANLTPSMSALIISKHVKEGVETARKYKLNKKIIDFITQHHGDSTIAYFYQKAIEKAEDGTPPKEENFRYPGPKPQTKESAIILLADSVEASSRTLDDPTPSSIRNLVKKIINNKFIDGQLEECDLTLKDINKIADSFVRVLMGVFHTRLDYPDDTRRSPSGALNGEAKGQLRKPKQKKKDRPFPDGEDSGSGPQEAEKK